MLGIVGFFIVFAISFVPIYFIDKKLRGRIEGKSNGKQSLYRLGLTGLGVIFMFAFARLANKLVELFL